ncbi:MAG: prepilin-type N-terminal cleavage/methylation domain-containing protein [Lachnospiraceae bacterium]|nr:prepilin-type N-terminal cleavage/methylation domain-containing protein [Lachnospiraceae bacterium]
MKKTKKGFTLVELVIVVAVMAVLVAVAIPTVSAITGTAKDNVAKTNAQTIESMIKLKEAEIVNSDTGVTGALTVTNIAEAIVEAKLGIDTGDFVYNTKTGTCIVKPSSFSQGDDDVLISFDATNKQVTVTPKTAANAVTKKLDGSTTTTAAPVTP